MYYQRITPDHAQAFFNLRPQSVTDHPEAFSTTPQEELAISLTALKDKLHPTRTPLYLAFGAFTSDHQLVGRCVLYQGDLPGGVHGVAVANRLRGTKKPPTKPLSQAYMSSPPFNTKESHAPFFALHSTTLTQHLSNK